MITCCEVGGESEGVSGRVEVWEELKVIDAVGRGGYCGWDCCVVRWFLGGQCELWVVGR